LTGLGAFAEEVVVDAQRVLPIPDAMEFASAAAFPVAYGTSHGALEWRAHLQSGEWLLVTGAAGGVGLASQTRCGPRHTTAHHAPQSNHPNLAAHTKVVLNRKDTRH
jgi:D-arabinose 1-dehydrogenase-like Zn-dependent alcohol dehydrogenase